MKCSCCGEQHDESSLTALRCHPAVQVCRGCIDWLVEASGSMDVTPTLPVLDMDVAVEFYEAAGFEVHRYEGGGFAFVSFDERSVFDLGVEPVAAGAGAYLVVPDPDGWHDRLEGKGLLVSDLADQEWGMREFTLTDPFGNRLRFGRSL
ncbi:VOC family protein [Aquihabitans sp. G128]|uniref:bleomycin resistance protein n=1 Tax=Aquihabitans sp. G128 TaxID=2849779 RepID=UPI001C23889B|nr:VOC family protein [Aquihabitans sp. G128]QXC60582.1 VOC family protein [Aquihabitans sp. G128]